MEEQLRHAQKMQAIVTLAGGIAHDFNNILAGIIGYASLLSARAGKDRVLLGDVTSIQKLSWKGAGLVKELLAFARRDEFSPAPVDLNRLIRDVLSFVGETVGQRVTIRTDLSPGTPRVLGDVQQLYQLIMNLAFNGCESMPNGGTLSVTIATAVTDDAFFRCHPGLTAGPYVALTVSDTGEGIDEKIRERIFEPFFTTRESKMGRGLGLSVASGIAERHGGCINVESASGKGSVFTVYLPAIPATP
jgi:signal transduction histidine kinase